MRTWLGTDAHVVRHVQVCGSGHLAIATRMEIARVGIHRETDYELPPLHPPLIIACGDSDDDHALDWVARHATEQGAPLLLACLTGRGVRIGPLIEPHRGERSPRPVTQSARAAERPAGLAEPPLHHTARTVTYAGPTARGTTPGIVADRVSEADPRVSLTARLAATLIAAQAWTYLMGERAPGVSGRVTEVNPWLMESRTYKVIKVRH